jgi:hypothetical protein
MLTRSCPVHLTFKIVFRDGIVVFFACGLVFPRPSQAASSLETSTTESRAQATGLLQMADDDTYRRALDRRVSAMYEFWSHADVCELSALDSAGVRSRDSEALHFELPFEWSGIRTGFRGFRIA